MQNMFHAVWVEQSGLDVEVDSRRACLIRLLRLLDVLG